MKKIYQSAKVEILAPAAEDLITTSGRSATNVQVSGTKGVIQNFDGSFSNPV